MSTYEQSNTYLQQEEDFTSSDSSSSSSEDEGETNITHETRQQIKLSKRRLRRTRKPSSEEPNKVTPRHRSSEVKRPKSRSPERRKVEPHSRHYSKPWLETGEISHNPLDIHSKPETVAYQPSRSYSKPWLEAGEIVHRPYEPQPDRPLEPLTTREGREYERPWMEIQEIIHRPHDRPADKPVIVNLDRSYQKPWSESPKSSPK